MGAPPVPVPWEPPQAMSISKNHDSATKYQISATKYPKYQISVTKYQISVTKYCNPKADFGPARQDLAAGFAGAPPGPRLASSSTRARHTNEHSQSYSAKHTHVPHKRAPTFTPHTQRGRALRARQQQYRWGARFARAPSVLLFFPLCVWCECWRSFVWHVCVLCTVAL